MNAGTAGHAGTPQLKQFHMESIKEFPRGISDQVISPRVATASARRAPDSGQELGKVQPWDREATPSSKQQASSTKLLEPQAASIKPQAQRLKLQAASSKLLDLASWKKFQAPLIKGLY